MASKTVKNQSTSAQPVNFYFGNLEKSGILADESTDKTSSTYIILQNDYLHTKVKELEEEVREMTEKISELEEDNESLETSKTSLKGYVQNQGEFNRLSKNLVEIYDISFGNITKQKEELEWNLKCMSIVFVVIQFGMILFNIYNFDILAIIELLVIDCWFFQLVKKIYDPYCEIVKLRNIKNLQTVVKIKEEMKNASRGNDYLNELIDIM